MTFISTRGTDVPHSTAQALLGGAAPDGGLYWWDSLPDLSGLLLEQGSYPDLAARVLRALLPGFPEAGLHALAQSAYTAFSHPMVTPVLKAGASHVLELFHGPTAAFKDLALQALPGLLSMAQRQLTPQTRYVVLTATSGDTGAAAMAGFRDVPGFRVLVYYPAQGISPLQKAQMTGMPGSNLCAVGITGSFDAAQAGVKAAFLQQAGRLPRGMAFTSANSINIGRLAAQVVYYVYACRELMRKGCLKPGQAVDVAVPSGNFGNLLSGLMAKWMGMPIGRLVCATNANRVLADFLESGVYNRNRELISTLSPSMDILTASNLERLLYWAYQGDTAQVKALMESLKNTGTFKVTGHALKLIQSHISADCCTDPEALSIIRRVWREHRYLLDPHTAAAWKAQAVLPGDSGNPRLVLATASPFKFSDTLLLALGISPAADPQQSLKKLSGYTGLPIPDSLSNVLGQKPVHQDIIPQEDQVSDLFRRAGTW